MESHLNIQFQVAFARSFYVYSRCLQSILRTGISRHCFYSRYRPTKQRTTSAQPRQHIQRPAKDLIQPIVRDLSSEELSWCKLAIEP